MLTAEENELLTRVGPGTPGGELLRRYWQPVGIPPELPAEQPTKFVRILGEDLVLFKDTRGRVGLLADHCSHRGASLVYGRVEERGIACAYHGWLYDLEGNCLETPAEPPDSRLHLTVKHRAYPVQEYCGMYWAYLGPLPAPVLPRYDILEAGNVTAVKIVPRRDCNWLQIVENNVDQAHVYILHQSTVPGGRPGSNTGSGIIEGLASIEYWEEPFGIRRRQVHANGYDDSDLMVFPSTQRIFNLLSIKVPIDDVSTCQYTVSTDLQLGGGSVDESQSGWNSTQTRFGSAELSTQPLEGSDGDIAYYIESAGDGKSPPDAVHPEAKYRMDKLRFQDFTMLETQGAVAPRTSERLATSDRGVVLLRTILGREMEKVQQGLDPIGVIRDPDHDPIDTNLQSYVKMVERFGVTRF